MKKFNPFKNQSISVPKRFFRSLATKSDLRSSDNEDVVVFSKKAQKKHIMGQLIARITDAQGTKKIG